MKKKRISIIVEVILLFIGTLIITSTIWCLKEFGDVTTNQIVYTLTASIEGTDNNIIWGWIISSLITSVLIVVIFNVLILVLIPYIIEHKFNKQIENKIYHYVFMIGVLVLCFSLFFSNLKLNYVGYIIDQNSKTDVFEKKSKPKSKLTNKDGDKKLVYANAKDVKITGDNTNNLIFIYLESVENTFMDKASGGVLDKSCLGELTSLANNNSYFSSNDLHGGAENVPGTEWTIASMTAQQSGLPLKTSIGNNMDKNSSFMPGAKMIGDILKDHNYYNELVTGSSSSFGGTDKLYKQHGDFNIIDLAMMRKGDYGLDKTDNGTWGINDHGVFKVAKQELTKLASQNQKFNLNIVTLDGHTPNGVPCSYCPEGYGSTYRNCMACQSRQVSQFIEWCQTQSFYANTTIVLVGDHNSMASAKLPSLPDGYKRTTYNCIINSRVTTKNYLSRSYSRMDMFPTTLAAMGFKIEGNKLGLGTNLYSSLPTVMEEYGYNYLLEAINKQSDYLDKEIYQFN